MNPSPTTAKQNRYVEKELQTQILHVFGQTPELRVWRANTGVAVPLGRTNLVKFGVNGQADISGIVRGGRRLEIEVKSPDGRQRPMQVAFGAMIERFGGIYVVARSIDDVYAALAAAGVVLSGAPAGGARAAAVGGAA